MSRLHDYDVPDPVGSAWDRLVAWRNDNPVKVEGCIVGGTLAAPWLFNLADMWSWSAANLLTFGCIYAGSALAWAFRWEMREQAIQDWFDRNWPNSLRWFVPADSEDPRDGFWEIVTRAPTKSAAVELDKALAEPDEVEDVPA